MLELLQTFLAAINDLVPLESSNGQWGLEDYVVEVNGYECFHYQEAVDVLREDDEVVIRNLSTWELRERTGGGRLQITSDGRHLIDGACWGKRRRPGDRPEVTIPPRKRARLMDDSDASKYLPAAPESQHGSQQLIMDSPAGQTSPQVPARFMDEEDDEENWADEDYGGEDVSSDEEEEEQYQAGDPADRQEGEISDDQWPDLQNDVRRYRKLAGLPPGTVNGKTRQELLDELNRLVQLLLKTPKRNGKERNKMIEADESFQGFSSPIRLLSTKSPGSKSNETSCATVGGVDRMGTHIVLRQPSEIAVAEEEHVVESAVSPNVKAKQSRHGESSFSSLDSSDDSSSDEDSESGVEVDETSSSASQETFSEDDSNDSSNSGDSSSGSESEAESGISKSQTSVDQQICRTGGSEPTITGTKTQSMMMPRQVQATVPPGEGSKRTHNNNTRKRLNRVMRRLKEEGKLRADANFEELRAYLQNKDSVTDRQRSTDETDGDKVTIDEINARKEAIFQRINTTVDEELGPEIERALPAGTPNNGTGEAEVVLQPPTQQTPMDVASEPLVPNQVPPAGSLDEESSPKRARLDVASSRRMLFNALGVRNPKTPAAEEALREKLAKPVRQVQTRDKGKASGMVDSPADLTEDRWKRKLTIAAVECVYKDRVIETPPFPFKHPWQVRKEKEEEKRARREGLRQSFNADTYDDSNPAVQILQQEGPSQTMIPLPDDEKAPIPEDFEQLPNLMESDLTEGAYVAYKELHMNEKFEPEQSPYRVAWIMANNKGKLDLLLAVRYRRRVCGSKDEENGEQLYSGFEMPGEDEEPDDGVRELSFHQMIQPKLVMASPKKTLVSETQCSPANTTQQSQSTSLRGGRLNGSTESRVSETNQSWDTARRAEINLMIKDAGFDSALDDQLLKPLMEPQNAGAQSSRASHQAADDTNGNEGLSHQWRSSPVPNSSQVEGLVDSNAVRESSVPSESMIESVRYPNLSQLELATPSVHVQSSSHQEAQRRTPTRFVDTGVMPKAPLASDDENTNGEAEIESLPSAVALARVPNLGEKSQVDNDQSDKNGLTCPSALGSDGSISPEHPHDSDGDSIDSSGFPSLRAITSSRIRKKASKLSQHSPEPTRRSPRISKTTAKSSDWSESEPSLKASESQASRRNQIPEDMRIVDLTQTSTETSPATQMSRSGRAGSRAASASHRQGAALRKTFEGLGEKSFLRHKKRSL